MMKTTIKTLLATVAVTLAVGTSYGAVDSYLYWMVSPDAYNYLDSSKTPVVYDYATVRLDTDPEGTFLNLYSGAVAAGSVATYDSITLNGAFAGFESDSSFNTFLFELWTEGGDMVGFYGVDRTELASYIATAANPTATTAGSPYKLTGVVPEPTSGLLSLFGLAALALRRRKRA